MPRLSLWNPTKTNDFNFIDRIVGEHLHAGGTGVHVAQVPGYSGTLLTQMILQDLEQTVATLKFLYKTCYS